ncbi:hypothetical protein Btru_011338 [Bulinus truncatus]|nr:hypothetical protein Btru_011338 [Bulinus truncatus]
MDDLCENKAKVVKIVPNPKELYISNRLNQGSVQVKCTENGCSYVALNTSALGCHKATTHKIKNIHEEGTEYHYHCPVTDCLFNPDSVRYFKSLEIVRTHYMKLHSPKKFKCSKCDKTFGLERDCQRHEKECGETFICPECAKACTNKSALIKHCDYNWHKKPDFSPKPKQTEEKLSPPKLKNVNKVKNVPTSKKTPLFILPKPVLPVVLTAHTLKQHSLEIQTDSLGAQFFVTKMASELSVSQSVQTTSDTKSAGMQTVPDLNLGSRKTGRARKLSIAMQTIGTESIKMPENFCAAQTQTGDSILQSAMMVASIPVVKLSKSTQKSGTRKIRERKQRVKQTKAVLPNNSLGINDLLKNFTHLNTARDTGLEDDMATMSTQTNLSCIPHDCFNHFNETRLQDCHTQTSVHSSMDFLFPNLQISNDQVTQTKLYDSCIDQITQTTNSLSFGTKIGPGPFQDSDTQTTVQEFSIMEVQESHATITESPIISDVKEFNEDASSFPYMGSIGSMPLLYNNANNSINSINSEGTTETHSDLEDLIDEPLNVLSPHEQTNILSQLLRNVSSNFTETLLISEQRKNINNAVCTETQTFESLAMDSMTQTIDDLVWDIGTQTVDDVMADMMTQTGDELLEYLTNDTQTQTLESLFDHLKSASAYHSNDQAPGSLANDTCDNPDNASTQTMCDFDAQAIDLQGNSFALPWNSPSSNSEEENLKSDSHNLGTQLDYDLFDSSVDFNSEYESEKMSHMDTFLKETESSETQTSFDPFFAMFEDLTNQGMQHRCYESSQTQTTFDPILPSIFNEAETLQCSPQHELVRKETSETQTVVDLDFSTTRECQTPWEDFVTMETSETQTIDTDSTFSILY